MWTLSLIAAPAAEPLDLETEVYPHVRLEPELVPQEELLVTLIKTARQRCEAATGRQLITATWELWLDCWREPRLFRNGRLYLPIAPLQQQAPALPAAPTAGVLSVTYLDTAGVLQTLAADQYQVVAPQGPTAPQGYIVPAYAAVWPTTRAQEAAIKIRFTAGYGASFSDVPAALRQGMLLTVGELEGTREEQTIGTITAPNILRAENLWLPFRVWW